MTHPINVDDIEKLITGNLIKQLGPTEQIELLRRLKKHYDFNNLIDKRPTNLVASEEENVAVIDRELQKMEANWVWQEMEDSVKLIQQYRGLYVTALFFGVGWLLSQIVGSAISQSLSSPQLNQIMFSTMREREDIAILLALVTTINNLFVLMMLEQTAQMNSLSRYRFILGYVIGIQKPIWRWELWKESKEGTTRGWTNPLNVLFAYVSIMISVVGIIFPLPAIQATTSWFVRCIWGATCVIFFALLMVCVVVGIRARNRNAVADKPRQTWNDLV